jgi:hypothetical protein
MGWLTAPLGFPVSALFAVKTFATEPMSFAFTILISSGCAGSSRTIRKSSWIRNRALPFTPSNASYKSPSLAGAIDIVTRSRDQFTTSGYVVNKITAAGLRADFKNSIANLAKSHGDGPATFTGQFSISSPTFQSRPEHHCIAMAVAIRR